MRWTTNGDPDAPLTQIVTDPDGPDGALVTRRFVFDAHGREVQEFGQGTYFDERSNQSTEVTALKETRTYDLERR